VGIIGANGSGKSTLLKILAGVTAPTRGIVNVNGKVASLLELGAGFHPLLTGRENVYLNGRILGMTPADVDREFDRIVEFSGIEAFIDHPVETYSSGMFVRLGFAVAVHANPDIFLVDEVLSVGDEDFQRRCRERIGQLREQGKTIVFVSHDLSIVNTLCERVILLSEGTMVVRDSAQATIDYYLRLVGRKKGIHKIASGPNEAILSHGRLSVYHDQRESSAATGFQVHLLSMGEVHASTSADWDVVERHEDRCTARGNMPKLPVTQVWNLRYEDGKLVWDIALDVERAVRLNGIDANLFLPTGYTNWYYGEEQDAFSAIAPGQTQFIAMHQPDSQVRDAATTAPDVTELPPLLAHVDTAWDNLRLQWVNTDYVMGCRVLQAGGILPPVEAEFEAGFHPLMSITLQLGASREHIDCLAETYRRMRTLTSGRLTARFDDGTIRLWWDGRELTKAVNVYNSLYINDFWNNSQSLNWEAATTEERRMRVSGQSRRFPYRQEWEVMIDDGGIAIEMWLVTDESVEVQEYQASIGLQQEYERWETPHESGIFPPIEKGHTDWHHANHDYTAGTWAKAFAPSLPGVALEVTSDEIPFRMTAINTEYNQSARVLQALRTAEAARIRLEPGKHLLFSGRIRVLES
ncbi:MAG: ABC transporter ATP-binding protein, partial [Candidatus Hydrogenedentes bacterium]|nr:ABC transporter ATP-binding protein [Candidatus Hydrogenedentota bacterium]